MIGQGQAFMLGTGIRAMVAMGLAIGASMSPAMAAASERDPGRLVWAVDFNEGEIPEEWDLGRGNLLAVVPEAEGDENQVVTHTGDERYNAQMRFWPQRAHYRIEWRTYADPAHPDRRGGVANIRNKAPDDAERQWDTRLPFGQGIDRNRFTSIMDFVTDRRRRVGEAVRLEEVTEPGWHTYAIEKVGREITVEINGERRTANAVLPSSMLEPEDRVTVLLKPGAKVDDIRLYDLSHRVEDKPGGLRMAYYPSRHKIVCAVYANNADVEQSRITLRNAQGERLIEETVPVQTGTMIANNVWRPNLQTISLPELDEGRYELVAAFRNDDDGSWHEVGRQAFERERFAWEDNDLGITDEVLPPFEPIEVEGDEVRLVLRRHRLTGLGLPAQIEARGQDADEDYRPLLATPVRLFANGQALEGEGGFVSQAPNKVVHEGEAEHPAVTAKVRNIIEEDGCMRIELTLAPGTEQATLESLRLDVPLKDAMAPLWHLGTRKLRVNPAGEAPAGTGRVWDGRDFGEPFHGNFHPYLWLGAEARGVSWFADNDKGWVLDVQNRPQDSAPSQELIREDGVLTLRINFVQKPITLEEERAIVFGLMATPAKPMPEDWRAIGRRDARHINFSMPTLFGIPSRYGGRYPLDGDFSSFSFVQANRLGYHDGPDFAERRERFLDRWIDRHFKDRRGVSDALRESFRGRLSTGISRYRGEGADAPLTVYFDEFHGTTDLHDEVATYYSEWHAGSQWIPASGRKRNVIWGELGEDWQWHPRWSWNWRIRSSKLPRSYRDFAAWYGAKWLRHGFGLYFDNTFPRYIYDPIVSNAYRLPNGQIQPSAGIWAHRAYLRRIWTLHQQLYMAETPQIMMLHMTNTHIAPYMVWNESNVDLEWSRGKANQMFQERFSPALLRAETLGRKTGNIPSALANVGSRSSDDWLAQHEDRYNRLRELGLLVHEIKVGFGGRWYPEPMDAFGYGLPDCEVVNYWDDDAPLQVSDDQCKWLLLKRAGELMVVLCTWNPESRDVSLRFDADALDVSLGEASDVETGEPLALDGNALTIPLEGHGARLLRLK